MSEIFPLEELKDLLKKAKEADPDCSRFGAEEHRYEWNPPASLAEVEDFEQKIGVRLPEEYRNFLLLAGNGGAGPYYGLFSWQSVLGWIKAWEMKPELEAWFYPEMELPQDEEDIDQEDEEDINQEDIDQEDEEDINQEDIDQMFERGSIWDGCIPIGSQGDSYFMYLLVSGPNRGRIVYVEDELSYIFFPREQGFLAWYKRWLREIISGYHIFWFGTNLDGDENELRRLYANTTDKEEKIRILSSMEKFPSLSAESKEWIIAIAPEYLQEPDVRWFLELLQTAGPEQMNAFLEQRWEMKLYDSLIGEIYYVFSHFYKDDNIFLKHWGKRILKILPQVSQEHWYLAFQLFRECSWLKLEDVKGLFEIADKKEKPELLRTLGKLPNAAQCLDFFLKQLEEREDLDFLNAALFAVPIVKSEALFASLKRICEELCEEDWHYYRNAYYVLEHVRDEFINPKMPNVVRPHRVFLQIDDEIALGIGKEHKEGDIAVHPFIALVIEECFQGLPFTPLEWDQTLLKIKTLILKPHKRYIRAGGNWIYIIPPNARIPLKKPYYYALGDWSVIGRMYHLRRLVIEQLCIEDFSFLEKCKNIEVLSLYNTNFSDCRLLQKLPKLKKVDLRLCPLEHKEVLRKIKVDILC